MQCYPNDPQKITEIKYKVEGGLISNFSYFDVVLILKLDGLGKYKAITVYK